MYIAIRSLTAVALLAGSLASSIVHAHGDVTPQPVDVSTLKPLGEKLLDDNPYRGDKEESASARRATPRTAHVAMAFRPSAAVCRRICARWTAIRRPTSSI